MIGLDNAVNGSPADEDHQSRSISNSASAETQDQVIKKLPDGGLKRPSLQEDDGERSPKRTRTDSLPSQNLPQRRADRSLSRGRSFSREPSKSRRSSASSLNSLEAELLGISEKGNASGADTSPPPRREETSRSPQFKRRRPQKGSAYR